MKVLKIILGLALFGALVVLVQLPDPVDSPATLYQQLPVVNPHRPTDASNSFENLAGNTVADAVLYGELAQQADAVSDEFTTALDSLRQMTAVFPPADGAITLAKAARRGAIRPPLMQQLNQALQMIRVDPRSASAVEKFKDNFMPMFELAKRCRTWDEFQTILRQANSPDQVKVLTRMTSASPSGAQQLSAVLTVAARDSDSTASACLDYIMRQGPRGLAALSAAAEKGAPGLKFVLDHPGMNPANLASAAKLSPWQEKYQALRSQYGASVSALKYLGIAMLCAFLVLVVVPGRYLEKLVTRPGSPLPSATAVHYLLSAMAVGVVLAGLAYLLALTARPMIEPGTVTAPGEAPVTAVHSDSAFLSGTVVLLSLAIHAVVWFYVRSKIRQVEDDETAEVSLRLRRLDNLDVFLDLPLFTGLALTVIAFILITLDAGMSRHFAYTSTVVGILSAVSLRIRYQYPLKERLIQAK